MGRAFVNRTYNLEHSASTPTVYLQASLGFTSVWHQGLLSVYRLSLCYGGHPVAQWLATAHCCYARGGRNEPPSGLEVVSVINLVWWLAIAISRAWSGASTVWL